MGIRRGRRVPHSRAQSGWPSLTPSGQAVVALVVEGLSNPQITRIDPPHRCSPYRLHIGQLADASQAGAAAP